MTENCYAPLPDRTVVVVDGSDSRAFLQGLVTNDVESVGPARTVYAALLSAQGKYLHDFFIFEINDVIMIDCERARATDLIKRLSMFRLRADVSISDESAQWAIAVAFGASATERLGLPLQEGAARAYHSGIAYVDPRLPDLGARIVLPADVEFAPMAADGFRRAGFGAYDDLRLSHGVPDGSRDILVDKSFLLESNFEELNGIDFTKGCYVGQENTTRQKRRGTVRRRLMRVDVEGPLPAPGTPITVNGRDAGAMRSGRKNIGLAQIRLEHLAQPAKSDGEFRAGDAILRPVKPDWANF